MSLVFLLTALALVFVIALFTLDDLFIDAVAWTRRLGPRALTAQELAVMKALPRKRIAILVANWHEEDVLEFMIRGNVQNIEYDNYTFFLGVYPNDAGTWDAARKLEQKFQNVTVVVNSMPGPTSKGQLLNEMVRQIFAAEKALGIRYDLFLLQDSEDLVHPLSLSLLNLEAEAADFIQIPVFSLPLPAHQLVAGIYVDEFAEAHTKEMLVRAELGAPIPSAGVGTALSHDLVSALMAAQNGDFLNEDCLTEDYQLGMLTDRLGFKTNFVCTYLGLPDGGKDFIATREYFPDGLRASVRQKTRWTVGIAFQSARRFGWRGSWRQRYFLWRDRRGPLNGLLIVAAVSFLLVLTTFCLTHHGRFPHFTGNPEFRALASLNFVQMFLRLFQRMRATARVYGLKTALLAPVRWPVGNIVNTWAAWRAFHVYRTSVRRGVRPAWVKTQHKLPAQFGRTVLSADPREGAQA